MITLDQTTAQRIVDRAMQVIGHSVNVMTPDGVIIASGDPLRVGEIHQGARHVAVRGESLAVDAHNAEQFPGVRHGVNVPITVGHQVVAVVGISGEPAKVLPFADLVKVTAELMLEHTALLELGQHRRRQIEDTLLALINGRTVPQVWLERVGFDQAQPRLALIIEPVQLPGPDDFVISLTRQLEFSDKNLLLAQVAPQRLLVVVPVKAPGASEQRSITEQALTRLQRHLPSATHMSIVVAVGQHMEGNLQGCYESALATMTHGRRESPQNTVHCYSNNPVTILWESLNPGWQQHELLRPLQALHAHPRHSLYVRTLNAFFDANGDVQQCASALHLHRNTIRYRLKSIEQLTGLSPFKLPELLHLYLALSAGSLSKSH
ncbi:MULTISPECIES: sugar diacid recognition domain-containing protein [unclassified Marinobacter]|uniref:sugar diacid recognition domain-containing protein n=1 Tax=unclassified Marinobacter TaxID=83889 RepID=UPI000BF88C2F|nr:MULTISPECIES: sugar diacid recognition domain-containing protein [unclassified Marinobacter]PFG09738.1 carbohydrate diacid regulator [Marinobacter sp. LV10MA510-1]PFG51668.1 carbohydrate diacid regulator [Marinobacter sp. LV10R520-4]